MTSIPGIESIYTKTIETMCLHDLENFLRSIARRKRNNPDILIIALPRPQIPAVEPTVEEIVNSLTIENVVQFEILVINEIAEREFFGQAICNTVNGSFEKLHRRNSVVD